MINPHEVPLFPVARITRSSDGTLRVNDAEIDISPDTDAVHAGLKALSAHVHETLGSGGIMRVIGTDEHGQQWPFAVNAAGEYCDTPGTQVAHANAKTSGAATLGFSRRTLFYGGGALAVVLAGGVTGIVAARNRRPVKPLSTTPPPLTGAGAPLPIVPPPGVSDMATWSMVAEVASIVSAGSTTCVWVTQDKGSAALCDPATGAPLWSCTDYPNSTVNPIIITDTSKRSYLLAVTSHEVTRWDLPHTSTSPRTGTGLAMGVTYAATDIITTSPMPLIVLPTQTVNVISGDKLVERNIPAASLPLGATDTHIWVLDGITVRALTLADSTEDTTKRLALTPPAATAKAVRGYLLGTDRVLIIWSTTTANVTTLTASQYSLNQGSSAAIASTTLKSSLSKTVATQRSSDDTFFVIGDLVVTPVSIVDVRSGEPSKIVRVTPDGVYVSQRKNSITTYKLITATGGITEQPYATSDDQIPIATIDGLTYIMTTKLGSERLYALAQATAGATS